MVRRNISLPTKPERMIYSAYLRKLLVSGPSFCGKIVRPSICFIDPDSTTMSSSPVPQTFLRRSDPHYETNEVITAMTEWNMFFGSSKHSFIVLASLEHGESGKQKGCLHFVKTVLNAQEHGGLRAEVKQQMSFDQPIAAMCPYDQSRLIIGYGNLVRNIRLDESRRLIPGKPRKLESDVVTLSSKDNLIYVSTKRNSVVVLQVTAGAYSDSPETLELAHITYHNEPCLSHLVMDDVDGLLIASHAGGKISGYSNRVHQFSDMRLLPEVFSADMAVSSSQLHRARPHDLPWMVYGVTAVGAIYRFRPLREAEWRMLKFIYNITSPTSMLMRDQPHDITANPTTSFASELLFAPLFVLMNQTDSLHINGDHLRGTILSGGTNYISNAYSRCFQGLDHEVAVVLYDRLVQITSELTGRVDRDNCFVRITDWLRDRLALWI